MHDNLGARRDGQHRPGVDPLRLDLHLPPGHGSLPWERIAATVAAHPAPLMLEIEPSHRVAPETMAFDTRRLLDVRATTAA